MNLIRQSTSEDDLELQEFDVIYTDKSQIAGTIQLASLKVESVPLGPQQLKLEMLRRLQLAGEGEVNALPDPGNLTAYRNQVGKTLIRFIRFFCSSKCYEDICVENYHSRPRIFFHS